MSITIFASRFPDMSLIQNHLWGYNKLIKYIRRTIEAPSKRMFHPLNREQWVPPSLAGARIWLTLEAPREESHQLVAWTEFQTKLVIRKKKEKHINRSINQIQSIQMIKTTSPITNDPPQLSIAKPWPLLAALQWNVMPRRDLVSVVVLDDPKRKSKKAPSPIIKRSPGSACGTPGCLALPPGQNSGKAGIVGGWAIWYRTDP